MVKKYKEIETYIKVEMIYMTTTRRKLVYKIIRIFY